MLEAGLVDRHYSFKELRDLSFIHVDTGNIDTKLRKACSGNKTNITGTNHCNMHLATSSSLCTLCILCASVVSSTTETQRTQRVHREEPHSYNQNLDRKSTRLNSSHSSISYAVFCLKKKN